MEISVMKFTLLLSLVAGQTIYFIRHGEKDTSSGEDLDAQGYKRASCLASTVFAGSKPTFKSPDTIIAQDPAQHSHRSYETVEPLAQKLAITVQDGVDRDDVQGAVDLINQSISNGSKTILVAWEHQVLSDIASNFASGIPDYPGSHFDIVWMVDVPTQTFTTKYENCGFK
ncbi:hypothetical protein HDV04_000971 [Boothiomyces sp. JEL0838]|nr:hypothetical protein HDV04_000971 [Boothiomyces sp. JEL0838]